MQHELDAGFHLGLVLANAGVFDADAGILGTGVPSPALAGGPTSPTSPTVPAPAAPGGELSGIYTFTVEDLGKHNFVDDHTMHEQDARQRHSDEFVGW